MTNLQNDELDEWRLLLRLLIDRTPMTSGQYERYQELELKVYNLQRRGHEAAKEMLRQSTLERLRTHHDEM